LFLLQGLEARLEVIEARGHLLGELLKLFELVLRALPLFRCRFQLVGEFLDLRRRCSVLVGSPPG
jgi:hypothetical protein